MEDMLITTRLSLEPVTADDCKDLALLWSLPQTGAHLGTQPIPVRFALEILNGDDLPMPGLWAVRSRQSRAVIGCISLRPLARRQAMHENDTARFGIALLPSHQGKGLGSEAARAIFERAIEALQLHTIVGTCDQNNVRGHRMLDALGFAPLNQTRATSSTRVDRILLTDSFRHFAPTQADQLFSQRAI